MLLWVRLIERDGRCQVMFRFRFLMFLFRKSMVEDATISIIIIYVELACLWMVLNFSSSCGWTITSVFMKTLAVKM